MSKSDLIKSFPWIRYSKKVALKVEYARSVGRFTEEEGVARQMRVVDGVQSSMIDGDKVLISLLVDPEDGMIVDAKFQAYGHSALIAAAEGAVELLIHKYYDQARRIGADLIDKHLRDKPDVIAFPEEVAGILNLVVDAIDEAVEKCSDIVLPAAYVSPVPHDIEVVEGGYPGFDALSREQKISVIEQVIANDVRPYIELDGGGIDVINLIHDREVIISYKGSCTSCFSSTGATLSYIQQIIQAKVHPDLTVVPDFTIEA
ncbi:MAG: NifU family protein [Chlamydiales bacterium]|nr:NifU family protein [Chlamydiales bacterium]